MRVFTRNKCNKNRRRRRRRPNEQRMQIKNNTNERPKYQQNIILYWVENWIKSAAFIKKKSDEAGKQRCGCSEIKNMLLRVCCKETSNGKSGGGGGGQ